MTSEGGEGVRHAGIWEKEVLAGGTTSAKVLGREDDYCVQGKAGKPVWLEQKSRVEHSGQIMGTDFTKLYGPQWDFWPLL